MQVHPGLGEAGRPRVRPLPLCRALTRLLPMPSTHEGGGGGLDQRGGAVIQSLQARWEPVWLGVPCRHREGGVSARGRVSL